ncbi:MAG: glycosyltransferase family 2 protein [Phycisphaerae bacterium]|nr:glycosyltransferase family 2 protein [Phycisphaerae bacterium]
MNASSPALVPARAAAAPLWGPSAGAPRGRRYVIVSPCRDEAAFMRRTLESVSRQTVPPALWVVVDDGSTDETPAILAEYEKRLPYLRVVRRTDRGGRSVGPGVIVAFYEGLARVDLSSFEYLCKLDMDLDLPERYFETLLARMEAEPRLATCSGKAYFAEAGTGRLISEGVSDEVSIGASKFYRVRAFAQIGGFVREVMWDGIDCHRCRLRGWIAQSWDEPALNFLHLRPMGSSDRGILRGRVRHGFGQYFMGTSAAYMFASAVYRLPHPPVVIGALAHLWGFFISAAKRVRRYEEPGFRPFLRRYQWACLIKGKKRATAEINERQRSVWKPDEPGLGVDQQFTSVPAAV